MVFRSSFGKWLTGITCLVLLWALMLTGFQVSVLAAVSSLPAAALIGYLVYLLFWVPSIEVTESALVIRNVFTTYAVPYEAIQRIDTKWSLTLFTEAGKISAFGSPAPGRHSTLAATRQDGSHLPESSYVAGTLRPGDLVTSDSGAAASAIRRYWERSRDAGFLGATEVTKSFHRKRLVFLLVLTGAVLVSLFGANQ